MEAKDPRSRRLTQQVNPGKVKRYVLIRCDTKRNEGHGKNRAGPDCYPRCRDIGIVYRGTFCKVFVDSHFSAMIYSSAVAGLTALILLYALFRRFTRPSLSMIRGPKSPSFFLGTVLSPFLPVK